MPKKDGDKGKNGNDDLDLSKNPIIIEMGKTMTGLATLLTQQGAAQAKTNEGLNSLMEAIKKGELGEKKVEKDKDVDPDAINDLENSQLVPLVLSEVGKLLDKKLETIGGRIDNTDKKIADTEISEQVKALIPDNPDLFDWAKDIKAFSTANPDTKLSVKQILTLVKEENPTKVAEMAEKYKDKGKDGEDKDKDNPGLLGFMPTSGVMTTEDDEKLTKAEAADKAWEDTLEKFPAIAQLGEG